MSYRKFHNKQVQITVLIIAVFALVGTGYLRFLDNVFAESVGLMVTVAPPTITPPLPVENNVRDIALQRIIIPSIQVNAVIESVGLTPVGAVDVPKGPKETAWFNLAPYPGEMGNSIIVGHSGWKDGIPAVFDELHRVSVGDKIYVENILDGSRSTFVVREIRIYNQQEDASRVFVSSDGGAHLNLITCTGLWSHAQQGRLDRLVIFSDKVENEDVVEMSSED